MNLSLFYVILFGGIPVVVSYWQLSQTDSAGLWAGLQGWVFYAWMASMALTVISYFYLFYMFVWGIDDAMVFEWSGADIEPWLCAIYSLFLGSASQYAFISIEDLRERRKSFALTANLWLTALASILISTSAIAINGVSDAHNVLSIVAGLVLAVHHIFFDAIYWLQSFDPEYDQIV